MRNAELAEVWRGQIWEYGVLWRGILQRPDGGCIDTWLVLFVLD